MSTNSSESTLFFLIIIAAFVIGIALINFINLSTAKSMERAKEVGLKMIEILKRFKKSFFIFKKGEVGKVSDGSRVITKDLNTNNEEPQGQIEDSFASPK